MERTLFPGARIVFVVVMSFEWPLQRDISEALANESGNEPMGLYYFTSVPSFTVVLRVQGTSWGGPSVVEDWMVVRRPLGMVLGLIPKQGLHLLHVLYLVFPYGISKNCSRHYFTSISIELLLLWLEGLNSTHDSGVIGFHFCCVFHLDLVRNRWNYPIW